MYGRPQLVGIFLISQSLLMLEVVLTRIFSVIAYYHFAVLSISLALLGAATAGVAVYLFPKFFNKESFSRHFTYSSMVYSATVIISLWILLQIPVKDNMAGVMAVAVIYLDLAVPFFFGGLCISLGIVHLASHVSRVYFADLAGAAIGCLLAIPFLDLLGGPGAVLACAVIGALAGAVFSIRLEARSRFVAFAFLLSVAFVLVLNSQMNLFKVLYVKGKEEKGILFEGWNSFSRVSVLPESGTNVPFGWGLSRNVSYSNPGYRLLRIDGMAVTPINRFDGNFETVSFLKQDVSSLGYYLRTEADVFIIGPGGGRDVLTALAFGAKQVEGVELNPLVVHAVRNQFADYAGHIYTNPMVKVHVDDGRNFLARTKRKYDIIQASAVDTWAATAAGAFALSENSLYTQEAFRLYFDRLNPDGLIAFSRYIYPRDHYGEALRLLGLALTFWPERSVKDPRQHLLMAGSLNASENTGYVSLLVKRSPFNRSEVQTIEEVCDQLGFKLLYAPFGKGYGLIRKMAKADDPLDFIKEYRIDISPPTDDRPFFFQMLRLSDIFRIGPRDLWQKEKLRFVPILALGTLLMTVTPLAIFFIVGPMWLFRREALRGQFGVGRFLTYFSCLGVGFMMVEVGLIQKFVLFLGHPTYALAVVLFSLLIATSFGSRLTQRFKPEVAAQAARKRAIGILVLLPLYILFLPKLHNSFMWLPQYVKVVVSVIGIFPIGLLMGTLFPLGIKMLTERSAPLIPWCWSVNGATSVFASVFAIAIGIQFGIRAELIVGWAVYLVAVLMVWERSSIELGT